MAKTFEEIVNANGLIKTTEVSGKDYAEVNQRVKAFRSVYPEGFIHTELVSNENGVCVFRANVGYYDESGKTVTLATGTAYEKEGNGFINKTSYIENCETSAVGRALGMAGYGIDVSIASAEEVQNAIINQKKDEPVKAEDNLVLVFKPNADPELIDKVDYFEKILNGSIEKVLIRLNKKDINDLTVNEMKNVIDMQKAGIAKRRELEAQKNG